MFTPRDKGKTVFNSSNGGLKHQISQEERGWITNNESGKASSKATFIQQHPAPFERRLYEAPVTYHSVSVEPFDKHWEPALFEHKRFNPDADANTLRNAMRGKGTDERAIVDLLTRRSNHQRQVIAEYYKKLHGRDLLKDLMSELSSTSEEVIFGLMLAPETYDALTLNNAVAAHHTDEETLVEVIGSRSPEELNAVKRAYRSAFQTDLEKDVSDETTGVSRQFLLARLRATDKRLAHRGKNYEILPKQAFHEAQALWETGPTDWSRNASFWVPIFTERSEEHLRQVFADYKQIGGIDIEKDIDNELYGESRDLLLACVRVAKNRPLYFADRIHGHINCKTASRIIISRAEKDLGSIKKEYARRYGQHLEQAVSDEFGRDSRNVLVGVLTSHSAAI